VPVAIFGTLFFALVLAIVGVAGARTSRSSENAPAYVFALSTIGLAFVLYLAWASYFVLGTFCILCALTYLSVIAIFILSGGATSFPMTTLPDRARHDIRRLVSSPVGLVIALFFVVAVPTVILAFPHERPAQAAQASTPQSLPPVSADERAKLAQWWAVQPKVDLPVSADGAKVLVVKFNDFQCPGCKATYEAYKAVFAKYDAKQVKFVLKHYPLEPECNPNTPGMNHFASCEASAAVIMAGPKGTQTKLEDWIFDHIGPPMLTSEQVKDAARTVGGITDFDAQYPRALEQIKVDTGLGGLLNVNGTPTFFINGKRLPGQILAPQYFDVLIQLELERTK
jgi:protein-disulfide isomerase